MGPPTGELKQVTERLVLARLRTAGAKSGVHPADKGPGAQETSKELA